MNNIQIFITSVIELYSSINNIDKERAYLLFNNLHKYFSSSKNDRDNINPLIHLEDRWYNKLNDGYTDYSVYNDEYYFIDLMYCYWKYSKEYIKILNKKVFDDKTKSITDKYSNISSILDLGCGLGYTTNNLSNLYPQADIYCTNIKNTPQWHHCTNIIYDNVKLLSENDLPNRNIDIVFASEFFEHIEYPIEYLQNIIVKLNPKILIIANSFNTKGIGHFLNYKCNDTIIPQEKISRLFNNHLIKCGYVKEKTAIWNNKPSIWVSKNINL